MTDRDEDETLQRLAREAFPLTPDPRDAALARLIMNAPQPRTWTARMGDAMGQAFAPRHAPVWGAVAAACFVLGLTVGWLGRDQAGQGFTVGADGALADAALVRVLDRGLAADGADGGGRAVGLTFRDADARWCRTFQAGEARVAGLACRADGRWRLQVLAPFEASAGEIRTAGAETPPAVLAAVDALIAGDTLDAAAEARARDGRWLQTASKRRG